MSGYDLIPFAVDGNCMNQFPAGWLSERMMKDLPVKFNTT